jgi:hypothetical protein
LNRDLDLLTDELNKRRKTLGSNYETVQRNVEDLNEISENMTICSDNITRWKENIEIINQKYKIDGPEAIDNNREIQDHISQIDKKWSTLHVRVKDYRDQLANANKFCKLYEDADIWLQHKNQMLNKMRINKLECKQVKEIEFLINQIDQNIEDAKKFDEEKIRHLNEVVIQINGNSFLFENNKQFNLILN